jgi:hypothetical protein
MNPPPGIDPGIVDMDILPFAEMVEKAPDGDGVDLWIDTPGGDATVVNKFSDIVRGKYDDIQIFVINQAMSAGTVWAMSGDGLWMDSRAALGPIDPQVRGKDGQYVPLQAMLVLVEEIEHRAKESLAAGQQPRWTDRMILANLDAKALGNAYSISRWIAQLAAELLYKYKFRHWTHHSNGKVVTPDERRARAQEIGELLASHGEWKSHSHGISREILRNSPLRLKVESTEGVKGLSETFRRTWAIAHWMFESGGIGKLILSQNYGFLRHTQQSG